MFKFLFTLIGIFLLLILFLGMRTVGRIFSLFFGKRKPASYYTNREKSDNAQPETQEERIVSYQKKKFEASEAEDVEFEEIKDEKR